MESKRKKFLIIGLGVLILVFSVLGYLAVQNAKSTDEQKQTEVSLIQQLPYETDHFKIEYASGEYTISLYAILNYDYQLEQYNKDLKTYKQEAIDWLAQNNIDYLDLNIIWAPEEAESI